MYFSAEEDGQVCRHNILFLALLFKSSHTALQFNLIRGEFNISQLQGEIEFNTFLFDNPYNWCI